MAVVRAEVVGCGQLSTAMGTVKVHVRVSPAGSVDSVTVESTPEAALGACVAAVIQKAKLAPTQRGGSFSYPFVFGPQHSTAP
jgi:TonB family protein